MVSAKAARRDHHHERLHRRTGNYYFPPLPAGQVPGVGAGARRFDTAKGDVDLGTTRRQNFVLEPLEEFVRQLPGNMLLAALPDETSRTSA